MMTQFYRFFATLFAVAIIMSNSVEAIAFVNCSGYPRTIKWYKHNVKNTYARAAYSDCTISNGKVLYTHPSVDVNTIIAGTVPRISVRSLGLVRSSAKFEVSGGAAKTVKWDAPSFRGIKFDNSPFSNVNVRFTADASDPKLQPLTVEIRGMSWAGPSKNLYIHSMSVWGGHHGPPPPALPATRTREKLRQ